MNGSDADKQQVLVLHDGDLTSVVRMLAAARLIRSHHRTARITLLTGPDFESLLKYCPYFNAVETGISDTARKNFFDRLKAARNSGFDIVYDLGAGSASNKIRAAMRFARTRWVEAVSNPKAPGHPLDQIADQLGAAGLCRVGHALGEAPGPELDWVDFVAKRSRTLDPAYFGLQERYALFCPAGDDSPPAQRWPKERWASLAHELRQKGVEPVIVGGPSTRELGRYIAHITPGARDLTGRANLIQLAGLGRQAQCAFGEDVALLHMIVAAGSPAVMFHPGDNAPIYSAPRGSAPTLLMHAPTLAQISPSEAVQAMRCAGGFAGASVAA
ncbi:glycosyltransferase family 9 protein [Alkalicaulis satelles]|uniref:Glycosyltransferase family 9 protein n=1 Tax=Alkalicaulis satelles TaxID=2609175 RepID=A0A5M6ZC24_9PROT|nr:glycosyltransferase family 9 protein [Alkalicaulis satelles]KAA5802273.1 glycosyltransferase family 9 protein [Alkalicaulis satelles]